MVDDGFLSYWLVGRWATPKNDGVRQWRDDDMSNMNGKLKFMATSHHQPDYALSKLWTTSRITGFFYYKLNSLSNYCFWSHFLHTCWSNDLYDYSHSHKKTCKYPWVSISEDSLFYLQLSPSGASPPISPKIWHRGTFQGYLHTPRQDVLGIVDDVRHDMNAAFQVCLSCDEAGYNEKWTLRAAVDQQAMWHFLWTSQNSPWWLVYKKVWWGFL